MPAEIQLSSMQNFILSKIAQSVADDEDAQPHWAPILLAAADQYATTGVDERTGASDALISQVVEKWKEAKDELAKAEQGGTQALQNAIEGLYEDYEDFEDECFCCCDEDDEEDKLTSYELEMLAGKVYNLLRMELTIERERLGYAYFSRN